MCAISLPHCRVEAERHSTEGANSGVRQCNTNESQNTGQFKQLLNTFRNLSTHLLDFAVLLFPPLLVLDAAPVTYTMLVFKAVCAFPAVPSPVVPQVRFAHLCTPSVLPSPPVVFTPLSTFLFPSPRWFLRFFPPAHLLVLFHLTCSVLKKPEMKTGVKRRQEERNTEDLRRKWGDTKLVAF